MAKGYQRKQVVLMVIDFDLDICSSRCTRDRRYSRVAS